MPPSVARCPKCHEFIFTSAQVCRFCNAAIRADEMLAAAALQKETARAGKREEASVGIRTNIRVLVSLVFLTFLSSRPASARNPDQSLREILARTKGQILSLRHVTSDSTMKYDVSGRLGLTSPGGWTAHGHVRVRKAELKGNVLRIEADRIPLVYIASERRFVSLKRSQKVRIEIAVSGTNDQMDVAREWNKAFLNANEDLPENIEEYWKPFLECFTHPEIERCSHFEEKAENLPGTSLVGDGVAAPTVRSRTEPQYTESARKARVQGTVIFEAIVTKEGHLDIVRIIRPLGVGLEESAAAALSDWTFEPGLRAGEPVSVLLHIEVNFNLR